MPSVELPECVKQPLYEAGVMRALEDYEEEGVLTGYEVDPNVVSFASKFYHKKAVRHSKEFADRLCY